MAVLVWWPLPVGLSNRNGWGMWGSFADFRFEKARCWHMDYFRSCFHDDFEKFRVSTTNRIKSAPKAIKVSFQLDAPTYTVNHGEEDSIVCMAGMLGSVFKSPQTPGQSKKLCDGQVKSY